jgi:hypothetical protein
MAIFTLLPLIPSLRSLVPVIVSRGALISTFIDPTDLGRILEASQDMQVLRWGTLLRVIEGDLDCHPRTPATKRSSDGRLTWSGVVFDVLEGCCYGWEGLMEVQ